MRKLRGTYLELTARSAYQGTPTEDYLHITLTDEQDIPEAMGRLRSIYPNVMQLAYDNQRTRSQAHVFPAEQARRKSPLELFREFYETQNGAPLSPSQEDLMLKLVESVWEGGA
jgi:exonuclease SbcD